MFFNEHPDVSVVLREASVLVTDYSSIYIDFMVTKRPCVFFAYDLESYVSERGFLYDYESAIAGPNARTFHELYNALSLALAANGAVDDLYRSSEALFHQHDRFPSRRVIENVLA